MTSSFPSRERAANGSGPAGERGGAGAVPPAHAGATALPDCERPAFRSGRTPWDQHATAPGFPWRLTRSGSSKTRSADIPVTPAAPRGRCSGPGPRCSVPRSGCSVPPCACAPVRHLLVVMTAFSVPRLAGGRPGPCRSTETPHRRRAGCSTMPEKGEPPAGKASQEHRRSQARTLRSSQGRGSNRETTAPGHQQVARHGSRAGTG